MNDKQMGHILDCIDLERGPSGLKLRTRRKAFGRYIDGAGTWQFFAADVRHADGEHQFLIESHDMGEIDSFLERIGFERI